MARVPAGFYNRSVQPSGGKGNVLRVSNLAGGLGKRGALDDRLGDREEFGILCVLLRSVRQRSIVMITRRYIVASSCSASTASATCSMNL